MKSEAGHHNQVQGVIKDSIIILLIFAGLSFVDIKTAAIIAIICTALLLNRRIILTYNPGFVKGHYVRIKGKNVTVPNGTDVFDLSRVPSMEGLHQYVEVILGIIIPPDVYRSQTQ